MVERTCPKSMVQLWFNHGIFGRVAAEINHSFTRQANWHMNTQLSSCEATENCKKNRVKITENLVE